MRKQKLNERKTIKENLKGYLRIFSLITVSVIWILIQSFLENNKSFSDYVFTIIIILLVILTISYLISKLVVYILKIPMNVTSNLKQEDQCPYNNSVCCVNLAMESLKSSYRIRLDDGVSTKYGLFSEEYLIEKESTINNGEVWIVSYDLTAEALENQQSRIREINIKKGIKYRLFYINDITQEYSELQDNIKAIDNRYHKKVKLYPYERPISIFSFLFSLFGIIMLIDENGMVKEAFFTLYSSNDKIKEPIYIKMSYCMEKKYNKILYSIKTTARNPRDNQSEKFSLQAKKRNGKSIFLNLFKKKAGK